MITNTCGKFGDNFYTYEPESKDGLQRYEVYYLKNMARYRRTQPSGGLKSKEIGSTHVRLAVVWAQAPDAVYNVMQGEFWSPRGEARPMIRALGLDHTSMSVGDALVAEDGTVWVCDPFDWSSPGKMEPAPAPKPSAPRAREQARASASRGAREYNWDGKEGCVKIQKNRENGRLIGVYHGEQSGMETGDPDNPWVTVCEEHGTCVCHPTLKLAFAHAAAPTGWCEFCQQEARNV